MKKRDRVRERKRQERDVLDADNQGKPAPKIVGQIQATFFKDGRIMTQGIPPDPALAIRWGLEIVNSIHQSIVKLAMEGKLKNKGLIEIPKIILPPGSRN